jgi:hypothetical protein
MRQYGSVRGAVSDDRPYRDFGLADRMSALRAESPLHAADGPSFFDPVNRLWFSEA